MFCVIPSLFYKHLWTQIKTMRSYGHACWHAEKKITTIINISHYSYLKKKREKWMELNHEKSQCNQGESGGGDVWCCRRAKGQRSGLLVAPLALYRPPQELLHVPRHVHGVVQVEVSVCVQHRVAPADTQRKGDTQKHKEETRQRCQSIDSRVLLKKKC